MTVKGVAVKKVTTDCPYSQQVMKIGAKYYPKEFSVIAVFDEPVTTPITIGDMHYNLMEEEKGYIPKEAQERLNRIRMNFIPVTQVYIGHEVVEEANLPTLIPIETEKSIREKVEDMGDKLGKILIPAITFGGMVFGALIALIVYAVAIDPNMVICVQEDNGKLVWIQIAWWPT